MSYLREIMQKLAAAQPSAAPVLFPAASQLESYRQQLSRCNSAMLQYEWTWLHQHLEDLRLCADQPEMARAAGGSQHVHQLIEQGEACLQALAQEFSARQLRPERQAHSVATGEHAWQVSNATIRRQWGFDGEG